MSEGMTNLEQRISQFEGLIEEMKDVTREAHSVLKQIRQERKDFDRAKMSLEVDVKKQIEDRVSEIVKGELDRIGPKIRQQTSMIYDKVGREIDKLIDIALGKEFALANNREDLRPALGKKLREWIREIIELEQYKARNNV